MNERNEEEARQLFERAYLQSVERLRSRVVGNPKVRDAWTQITGKPVDETFSRDMLRRASNGLYRNLSVNRQWLSWRDGWEAALRHHGLPTD